MSPSISAWGVKAATESMTIMSTAPERMSDSAGARLHRMAEGMPQTLVRTGSAENPLDSVLKRDVAFL